MFRVSATRRFHNAASKSKHLVRAQSVNEQFVDLRWRGTNRPPQWATSLLQSRKNAKGLDGMEGKVGITATLLRRLPQLFREPRYALERPPNGLVKWAPDDFLVEDLWDESSRGTSLLTATPPSGSVELDDNLKPEEQTSHARVPAPRTSHTQVRMIILSQCAPLDDILENVVRRVPNLTRQSLAFATDHDAVAWRRSSLLVRGVTPEQLRALQAMQHQVFSFVRGRYAVDSVAPIATRRPMPDQRYHIVVRDSQTAVGTLGHRLDALASSGFINYCSVRRHGLHAFYSYQLGKALLERNFTLATVNYLGFLAADHEPAIAALRPLRHCILNENGLGNASPFKAATAAVTEVLDKERRLLTNNGGELSGLTHHGSLLALVRFLQAVPTFRGDGAAVLRELVDEGILRDHVTTLSDVAFNALASLRIELLGTSVVVGDLVAPQNERRPHQQRWDCAEIAQDFVPVHRPPRWHETDASPLYFDDVRLVTTPEEAKRYTLADVVLPKPGSGPPLPLFPTHRCGREALDMLLRDLGLMALGQMRLAPTATYRHLMCKPLSLRYALFNDTLSFSHGDTANVPTYLDAEGVRRQLPPTRFSLPELTLPTSEGSAAPTTTLAEPRADGVMGWLPPARSGIKKVQSRAAFLEAGKGSDVTGGTVTTVLKIDLPRGAAVSSLLREFCSVSAIDSGTIVDLLNGPPEHRRSGSAHTSSAPHRSRDVTTL